MKLGLHTHTAKISMPLSHYRSISWQASSDNKTHSLNTVAYLNNRLGHRLITMENSTIEVCF
jgi:hypothetical protein